MLTTRQDGSSADCNACVGTGLMIVCCECEGSGMRSGLVGAFEVEYQCPKCDGKGLLRCMKCDAAGEVWVFERFCAGDGPEYNPQRRHPNSQNFQRRDWGRVEVDGRQGP